MENFSSELSAHGNPRYDIELAFGIRKIVKIALEGRNNSGKIVRWTIFVQNTK